MKRQWVSSVLVAAALGLGSVGLASPASATQTESFANCQAALDGQTIEVAAGEDLLLTFSDCPWAVSTNNLYLGSIPDPPAAAQVTIDGATFSRATAGGDNNWRITGRGAGGVGEPLPGGSYTVYFWLGNAGTVPVTNLFDGSFTVNVANPAPGPAGTGPAPVIQQFGKPATGTCDAHQPDLLNWANVASGGWTESWAQWMNGGAGGSVCTRTLAYLGGSAGWGIVAPQ